MSWQIFPTSFPPLPFLHTCSTPQPHPPSTLTHFLCRRVRGSTVAPQVVQRGPPSSLSQTPTCRICPPRKGRWVLYGLLCALCVCVCVPPSVVCVCVYVCMCVCTCVCVCDMTMHMYTLILYMHCLVHCFVLCTHIVFSPSLPPSPPLSLSLLSAWY